MDAVKKFKWMKLSRELQHRDPTLCHALKAGSHHPGRKKGAIKYILPMAAAVLLRGRNLFLCMPQTVISTIVYTGHCSKMVRE